MVCVVAWSVLITGHNSSISGHAGGGVIACTENWASLYLYHMIGVPSLPCCMPRASSSDRT